MVATVRTVLGDIPAGELGVCDAHDHLFLRSPVLPGQELDDRKRAAERLRDFRGPGGRPVVQWTPYGMGRGADTLASPARSTGMHVVAATGLHQAAHYTPELLDRVRDSLADPGRPLLLGGDTTVPETPGMPHLLRRLRPRLEHTLGKQLLDAILIENPARAFTFGPTA
nr:hypothetical protein OG781_07535 [Streptomyces sp. NBC_00830]